MKGSLLTILLLLACAITQAQPNIQQLENKKAMSRWLTDPPPTIIIYDRGGGTTKTNAFGEIVETSEYGTMMKERCYFLTDKYSPYARKFGPQTYMLLDNGVVRPSILYSLKGNRLNPNCAKEINFRTFPKEIALDPLEGKTPVTFYRRNAKGEKVFNKEKFPEVIRKLFEDNPEYYEKYSPLCKQMNYSDDIYVSLLIEALLKYNQPPMSLFQSWEKIVFSANGFKAKSGRSSFRYLKEDAFIITYLYPLEPVVPAGTENDELVYYPDEEIFYSKNYLKQVQASKTVPQDYSNVQFKGEPCLLTDMYGFPAVFDDANMYYLEK